MDQLKSSEQNYAICTRDKRVPVAAAGSGPLAGKLAPEYPEWLGYQLQRRRVPARVAICCRKGDPFQVLSYIIGTDCN